MGLYAAFVDLTKAFDTVSRNGLWTILAQNLSASSASSMRVIKAR